MEPDPFFMLFRARWNIPQASKALGMAACEESWEKTKVLFREWCATHPKDHDRSGKHEGKCSSG